MKALLYCYRSGKINNALGLARARVFAIPLTSPPLTAETFPYAQLGEAELIYIALHGSPKSRMLYGDAQIPALSVDRILDGPALHAAVILEGCWGAKTPFPRAFIERGARMVIASHTQTVDWRFGLGEAGRIGSALVRALAAGQDVQPLLAGGPFELVERCG